VQDITERYRLVADLKAARAELELQRTRLHALFENAPAIVCTLRGPGHVFELANPLYQRVVGGKRPLVGLPLKDALPEVAAQGFISLLDRVYRTGEPYVGREVPLRLDRRGDGTLEDTSWTFVYQPRRQEGGAVEGIDVFGFEVTEHVRARQEAEALAAQLAAIFDSFPEPLYVGDERGIQRANQPAIELLGYRTLAEVNQGIALLSQQMLIRRADTGAPLPPEDNPFNQALQGRASSVDLLMRHQQTGEDRVVRNVCAPVRVGGKVVAAVGINHDITDRQQAEDARRESEERLRLVLDAIPALVAFLDPRHRYIFGNAAYGRWFGVDPETLPGRSVGEVIGEESYRRIRPYIERALAGEHVRYESPFVFGGGREGVLQAVYVPQRALDGRVTGYVAIAWDVSAERSAEQELRQRADFERQLIGIVSHDLRNPLQAIQLSAATLLRRAGQDDRQTTAILRISNTAERMTRMIRDLLDFTRARLGGGLVLERRPLDLHALARQVVDEVQLAHPGRDVEVTSHGDAQGTWDEDRLAQLLGNLLNNAIAYGTPKSPVRVETRGLDGDVLLEVANQGEPIAPEQLKRLFRPFERGENLAASAGRSIGLGLYIVDAIVRAHGGRIDVRSTAEEGTTFTVRLPRS
jgi:PAS domain S-box-containing protein